MNYTHKPSHSTNDPWGSDLRTKVKYLESDKAGKEAEISLLQNELTDVTSVSVSMTNITCIVADMLQDNINFVTKNGMTAKAKESRDRLMKLMNITETLNSLSGHNVSLKLFNKQLFVDNQLLRVKIHEMKLKLDNIEKAEKF